MRRYFVFAVCLGLLLCALFGCGGQAGTLHEHPRFTLTLPDGWERIGTEGAVCFAPDGEPEGGSSIVFYITEKNYYFSEFKQEDYAKQVKQFTGYDSLSDVSFQKVRINGWDAHRVSFATKLNGAPASVVLYAIDADQSHFFIFLDTDAHTDMFDAAMKTVKLTKQ